MGRTLEAHLSHPQTPVEEEVARLGPWFHNLHLPDGTQTAPDHALGDFPAFKWREIAPALPEDLSGWRVLDVGCNAGFYTFELARRGADVLGVDADERYLEQAKWAAARFGMEERVRFRKMQVYDLLHHSERYDLVMFMGVFYHLRYPVLALDILAEKTKRLMIFQSATMPEEGAAEVPPDLSMEDRDEMLQPGWPRMAFVEHRLSADPTNWWFINEAAAEALLRSAGLRVVARPGHEIYACEPDPESDSRESVMRAREQFAMMKQTAGR